MKRTTMRFILSLLVVMLAGTPSPARAQGGNAPATGASSVEVFEQAWTVVRDQFFDAAMNGVDWAGVRDELLPRARAATSPAEVSAVINAAASRLRASHTRHYHRGQREYYELLDVFCPDGIDAARFPGCGDGLVQYVGIGVVTATIDGRIFASEVYEAGPAAEAGLLVGDELLGVEERPWSDVAAFEDREGRPTRLLIQRTADAASRMTLTVTPARIHPHTLFKDCIRRSVRVVERNSARLGYVRIRSYANPAYQQILAELITSKLSDVDGLVLDLRGGWGGASPEYVNLFNPSVPTLESRGRGTPGEPGEWESRAFSFRKPLVLLVDRHTRSGKEIFAYALKKDRRAAVVGEPTAGAVLGGTPFALADGSLMFVAVRDVMVDGKRLEGVGVSVDVQVARSVAHAEGNDEQFARALDVLSTLVASDKPGK